MKNEKTTNYFINPSNQAAFEYALYMMASSYFAKATCSSPIQEQKLLLYYKDQKLTTQYEMENMCIRYMEKDLRKKLPTNIWDEEVTVALVKYPHCPLTEVRIQSSTFVLCLKGIYQRKSCKIEHSFWMKDKKKSCS